MAKLLQAYTRSFERRPYLTLLITNGALMATGDISAQALGYFTSAADAAPDYDLLRTMRFGVFGASMGPLAGAWNKFLEVKFPLRPAAFTPLRKVKVDDPPASLKSPVPGMKMPAGAKLERGGSFQGESKEGRLSPGVPASPEQQSQNVSVVALLKRVAADQLGMAPISLFIFLFSMAMLEGLDAEETKEKIRANYIPIILINWQVWPILQLINFRYLPLKYRVPFGSALGILWTCYLSVQTARTAKAQQIKTV